jgi:hypothetical protein
VIGLGRREAGVALHRHGEGGRVRAVDLPQRLDDEAGGEARVGAEAGGLDLVAERAGDPVDAELAGGAVAEQVGAGRRGQAVEVGVDLGHRRVTAEAGGLDLGLRGGGRGDLGGHHRPPEGIAG